MVGRLGEKYGVPVHETPVGFKYVGPKMIETGAMMGGEESGGYGFGMHLPERDGVYADLLLLDLFIREREAGRWPVSSAVQHLHDIAGPSFYLRTDVHADRATYPGAQGPAHGRAARAGAARLWPVSRWCGPTPCPPMTASSSGAPTARGSWCGSVAPSPWCGCTRRRRPRTCATHCSPRAAGS